MMKKTLSTIILFSCSITLLSAQIQFESSGYRAALAKASRLHKLVFVYFYTDWCVPCKQLPNIVFVDSLIRAAIDSHYVSLKLNAEKGEGLTLARRFTVGGFPTFLFLNTLGNEIGRVIGTRSNKDYLIAIRSAGRIDPFRDRLNQQPNTTRDTIQRR